MSNNIRTINYNPAGRVAEAFHKSDAFVRLLMGPVGSGKSTAACMEILWRAQEQHPAPDGKRYARVAIIRNSRPEIVSTTLKTWEMIVPTSLGKFNQQPPITHHIKTESLDLEVLFLGLDSPEDQKKLLSLELTFAWVEECKEISPAIISTLQARVGRFPSNSMGGCGWHGIFMTTNMPDTESWLYKMAEMEKPENWDVFKQPSGISDQAENVENLPANYYHNLMASNEKDWCKVFVEAQYGFVMDGKPVFGMYRDSFHAAEEDLEPARELPLVLGCDFGLTPAVIIAQRMANGQWRIIDELVAEDVGIQRFGAALRAHLQTEYTDMEATLWADPAGNARSMNDEQTSLEVLASTLPQVRCRPAPSNNITERLEAVKACLNRAIDGKPGFLISPRCIKLRKAMAGGYHYRSIHSSNGARIMETPEKNKYSHPADALQYLLSGGGEYQAVLQHPLHRQNKGFWPKTAIVDYDMLDSEL